MACSFTRQKKIPTDEHFSGNSVENGVKEMNSLKNCSLHYEENHWMVVTWMVVTRCLAIVQYSIRQSDIVKCAMTYSQSDHIQHDPHFSQLICFRMKAFILNTIFAIGLELIPFLNFTIDCVPLRHTNKPIRFF